MQGVAVECRSERAGAVSPESGARTAWASALGRWEVVNIIVLFLIALALRVIYLFRYRGDSDETQYLHIIWALTQGLAPYRDFFDNHTPLFYFACAPFFRLMGEQPQALVIMRLLVLPLFLLSLWLAYRIGCALLSKRVALWAAILTALMPPFFFSSLEFRSDDLWMALWLGAMILLVKGRLTPARSLMLGLILGAAVGVSMKTTLLLASLGVAVLATLALAMRDGSAPPLRTAVSRALWVLIGFLVVPVCLMFYLILTGAWGAFYADAILHNTLPGLGDKSARFRLAIFPPGVCFLALYARHLVKRAPSAWAAGREMIVFLSNGIYAVLLLSFWPLITLQDFLPFTPVAMLFLTPMFLAWPGWLAGQRRGARTDRALWPLMGPVLVAAVELSCLVCWISPWRNRLIERTQMLAEVLRLTDSDQGIADLKGETVFRRRTSYYVFETITQERFKRGLITDDIPERLLAANTCVVRPFKLAPRAAAFFRQNFIRVGFLFVAGQFLTASWAEASQAVPFDVRIATRYTIVSKSGVASGLLDGTPVTGPRFLEAGHHVFIPSSKCGRLALVWTQAVQRGFSPFFPRRTAL